MRGVFFDGKQRYKPGAYSKVNNKTLTPFTTGALRVLAIIGIAEGGEPQKVLYFNNPSDAEAVLRGGDGLTLAKIAWAPSKQLPGADLIAFIRVNPATKGTLVLQDTSGTPQNAITLTSKDWGAWVNDIQVKVEDGSSSGKKVTIKYDTTLEVGDNLADNEAIVAWVNANSQYLTAEITDQTALLVNNSPYANLTGGAEGTATATDWTDALALLETEKVHGILAGTTDASIHASVLDHCIRMSAAKKERRAFFGHALGENVSAITARATALNHQRALLATPGIKKKINGVLTTLSSVFTAAALAGMWAGGEPSESLTYKLIDCEGLETVYKDSDLETFIKNGVTAIESVPDVGYRVVHAITTHTIDDNSNSVELVKATIADLMTANIRETLEKKFAGQRGVRDAEVSMYNTVVSLLNMYEKDGWIVAGEDDAGNVVPAYRNVSIIKNGTAFAAEYEASILDPINFILLTANYTTV